MLVARTVNDGPWYASNGVRTGAFHVPTQCPREIIAMGAYDIGSGKRVTAWSQCEPVTAERVFAVLGAKVP